MTKQTDSLYVHSTHGFPAVYDYNSRILILGSHPSVRSKEQGFFYMHKSNRFWRVLSHILNVDLVSVTIPERKSALLKNNIALYDVVEECDIIGSSDSTIRNVVYADIETIIKSSHITHIFLNGKTACSLFLKAFPDYADIATLLPSTSPANAAFSLDRLIDSWKKIKINDCPQN